MVVFLYVALRLAGDSSRVSPRFARCWDGLQQTPVTLRSRTSVGNEDE